MNKSHDDEKTMNFISSEINKIIQRNTKKKFNDKYWNGMGHIKDEVLLYLSEISKTMGYPNIPEIVVSADNISVMVNFYDNNKKRLNTIGDLLFYMQGIEVV